MKKSENSKNKKEELESFLNKFRKYSDDFLLFLKERHFYDNEDSICKIAFFEILIERGLNIEPKSKTY